MQLTDKEKERICIALDKDKDLKDKIHALTGKMGSNGIWVWYDGTKDSSPTVLHRTSKGERLEVCLGWLEANGYQDHIAKALLCS